MLTPEEVDEFIEKQSKSFRVLRPIFAPDFSRQIQTLAVRWKVLGRAAVLGGGSEVFGCRLPFLGPPQYDPDGLVKLAKAAPHDPRADQLFRQATAELIGRGEPLPAPARRYAQLLLSGANNGPRRRRGRKADDNRIRNGLICLAVAALVENGFRATRNREQKDKESGCSIVRKALARAGIHKTEPAIEKIWNTFRRRQRHLAKGDSAQRV